jgi:hypothetical protein
MIPHTPSLMEDPSLMDDAEFDELNDAFLAELDSSYDAEGMQFLRNGGASQSSAQNGQTDTSFNTWFPASSRFRSSPRKRSRDKFEKVDEKNIFKKLANEGAVAVMSYCSGVADPQANDVWPNHRDPAKMPARYYICDKSSQVAGEPGASRRPAKVPKMAPETVKVDDTIEKGAFDRHRSEWKLPVELMEFVASYLNRDDIKSMRLVSRELNHNISQVIFTTVVVPFNTEIYGMLGHEPSPDLKGKKKAKSGALSYTWKNANGDDVYDGHGLDVFRGFGKHILRYGMSFEVNEDALSKPPEKSLTEQHTSFWGFYDWPYEEYRRFADIAGLETAADETPRMKVAFSELSRVKELALSIDSGLGWLNGPDRSIRGRILQRAPEVFGSLKDIPDRRAQAQQELWEYTKTCHQDADKDVKLANLYKLNTPSSSRELQEAGIVEGDQPEMPFLDPYLIYSATPHDTAEIQAPTSFDNPEVLDRFISTPAPRTGILFSSNNQPTDAGLVTNPIIPSNLTKAQKEWLLETEWAQRAFVSSYMLSVIDNAATFSHIHTLNIARLSDRYVHMLNRMDFWDSLPSLKNVTLMVLPSWRTVHKDQAGFVGTPIVSPSGAIDPFFDLLERVVSRHCNITELTIGWATGGEHAEGVHARNKLLLPAPLMTADMVINQNVATLRDALLKFPFVEKLTLKNCWITPSAMLQFVKLHDGHNLQHLVFNSVSLTAILRAHPNAHQVAPNANNPLPAFVANQWQGFQANVNVINAPAAVNVNQVHQIQHPHNPAQQLQIVPANAPQNNAVQAQLFQAHVQALQTHIQHLQTQAGPAYQNQLHNLQLQLVQAQAQQVQPANQALWTQVNQANHLANLFVQVNQIQQQQQQAAHPGTQPAPDAQTALSSKPRKGSWMNVIDIITPGPNLFHFGSEFSKADEKRTTALQSIEFVSCGYARLPNAHFDQSDLDTLNGVANFIRNPVFTKRYTALAPAMLSSKWPLLGNIVQDVDATELAALNAGWFLETGWKNEEEAKAAEFDGLAPGGTGRFTGIVRRADLMQTDEAS